MIRGQKICGITVTLTYAENMTDTEQLRKDFKNFIGRLGTYCNNREVEKPEYIAIMEPQNRGAWHVHMFLIWSHKAPFIPNADMARVWKHGFTRVKGINDNVDNVAAYLTPYLTNIPLSEYEGDLKYAEVIECDVVDENGRTVKKKFVKEARLKMYPANFKIYRKSRGIKAPTKVRLTYGEAKSFIGDAVKTYEDAYEIKRDDFENVVRREFYNRRKRK